MNDKTFREIGRILQTAWDDGRRTLHEYEVYRVLSAIGVDAPRFVFVRNPDEVDASLLSRIPGSAVMVKAVSRDLSHNQRYGGVKRVSTLDPLYIRYVMTSMREEVLSHFPPSSQPRIDGFLIVEFVRYTQALGNEILIGLHDDPAFGAVVTLSKGGEDAEFFSRYYDPPNLVLAPVPPETADAVVAGLKIRHRYEEAGHRDYLDKMARALTAASDLGHAFSAMSDRSPRFRIDTLDVNPLVFSKDGRFVAIDGYAEFSPAEKAEHDSGRADTTNLDRFFRPDGIAVLGVSSVPDKYSMAKIIVTLFTDLGRDDLFCVNPKGGSAEIAGRTYPLYRDLSELPRPCDLLVYAAPSKNTLRFLETVPENRAVILISGFPPDTDYPGFLAAARSRRPGIRIIGPNCMGVFQAPDGGHAGVNTLFIDESRLQFPWSERSNTALFTQSGAMGISIIERAQHSRIIRTIVSIGNKADVNIPDLMAYFEEDRNIDVMALYIEGIQPGEGREFYRLASASRKPVIVYKAGRTEAGAKAAASHTASMSGNYDVFRAACLQAGCVLTEQLEDFYNYTKAFAMLHGKAVAGRRVAGIVNAGLDATMGADTLDYLEQAVLSDDTAARLRALNRHGLVDIRTSFLDVTPMTDDTLYARFIEAVAADPDVDCLFVAVVPHIENLKTTEENYRDPDAFAVLLADIVRGTDKPIVVSVNAGDHYRHLVAYLEERGIPVFDSIPAAIRSLDRFVRYRIERRTGRQDGPDTPAPTPSPR
ncbi:MAG: acetate--CoA ligase family protein [Clostridia bacterium]|nr:acetate--CoA ligase family protein [Clostridia bacterium]